MIHRLALRGDGGSGPMGLESITTHLNVRDIRTRDGGHRFNTRDHKTRRPKPDAEHAVMAVPPIVTEPEWKAA